MKREIPLILMIFLMISIYGVSLSLVPSFESFGVKTFEKPENPMNILYFVLTLLALTLIIILIAKFSKKEFIYFLFLLAILSTTFTFFEVLLSEFISDPYLAIISVIFSILIALLLVMHPEWYVIDISGAILSITAMVIFGISLSVPLTILLLAVLAVYDAISVYKTKHMIDLADTVVELKLPALFIMPHHIRYRFRKQIGGIKKQVKRKEREAFFVGLGDVVMPGILVISVYSYTRSIIVSIFTVAGIVTGFLILMTLVSKSRAHAGLPFLNSGAILGYVLSSLILHGSLIGFSI